MKPHEIEKTIEFLLQHQAAAVVRQDRTDAQIAVLVEQNKTMFRDMEIRDRKLSERIEKLADGLEKVTGGLQTLRETCRDLLDHARWTDARIRRLEQPEG